MDKHERVARKIIKETVGGGNDEPEIETVIRILRREYGEEHPDIRGTREGFEIIRALDEAIAE